MIKILPVSVALILIHISSSVAMEDQKNVVDKGLLDAMRAQNLEAIFGPEVIQDAPVYDEDMEDYVGEHEKMDKYVQFVLYTSARPADETQIYVGNVAHLFKHGFNASAPTKIICHGYMSDYLKGPGRLLVPSYLDAYDSLNIILVNWATMAGVHKTVPKDSTRQWYDIFYFPPARNTEIVGNTTAALIEFLVQDAGVELDNIHLVGHSLGAHAMGHAGLHIRSHLKRKLPRITALDPAAPCFESTRLPVCFFGKYRSISKGDAKFVDVIHTHARAFGMKRPVGHADFYPNGGFSQPGCSWWTFGICSHQRAIELMADSIRRGTQYRAHRCSTWSDYTQGHCSATDCALLGEHCSVKTRGTFFLKALPNALHYRFAPMMMPLV